MRGFPKRPGVRSLRASETLSYKEAATRCKVRTVSGRSRLDSVASNRVASITVRLTASGSFRSLLDVDVTLEMTAHFRFDLTQRRPLSSDAHADGKVSGDVDRKGKPAVYSGEFSFDAAASNAYR